MDGPEVAPSTCPEVSPQPDGNKYYIGGGVSKATLLEHLDRSSLSRSGRLPKFKSIRTLAGIIVICFAVALGTGLGAGVAIRSSSRSSSGAKTTSLKVSTAPVTIIQTRNASAITACSTTLAALTPTPTPLATQICPAANGSTYVATETNANNPISSVAPWHQTKNSSLSFKLLGNINVLGTFHIGGPVRDLQIITNVSTLTNCVDECALYSLRTPEKYFPAWACTGVSWGNWLPSEKFPASVCWLKGNVTLGSPKEMYLDNAYDSAVMLHV